MEAAVPLRYSCASRRLPFEVWKLGTSNIVPLQRGEVKDGVDYLVFSPLERRCCRQLSPGDTGPGAAVTHQT